MCDELWWWPSRRASKIINMKTWVCLPKFRDTSSMQWSVHDKPPVIDFVQVGILHTIVLHTPRVDYWEGGEQDFLSFIVILGCWGEKISRPSWTEGFVKQLGIRYPQIPWFTIIFPIQWHPLWEVSHIFSHSQLQPPVQSQAVMLPVCMATWLWVARLGPWKKHDPRNRDLRSVALAGSDWLPPPGRIQEEAWTSTWAESFESLRGLLQCQIAQWSIIKPSKPSFALPQHIKDRVIVTVWHAMDFGWIHGTRPSSLGTVFPTPEP